MKRNNFVGWTRDVQLIFKWRNSPLVLVVVAATTTIFTFRNNASEQYQRNTDIIPKLFDIVPKVNFAGFSSYQKDNLISCARFAHLIDKAMWAGSQRPTPKSMGQNGAVDKRRKNKDRHTF